MSRSDPPCAPVGSRRRFLEALVSLAALAATFTPGVAQANTRTRTKAPARGADRAFGLTPAIVAFSADVAARTGIPALWIRGHLAKARRLAAVQRLVMPPPAGQAKNWSAYRARFIEPQRTAAGLAFWQQHAALLARAEAQYGVPAAVVVAVIGIETYFGRIVGNFRVIDALATLSFAFPTGRSDRSAFFRDELEALFVWTHRESLDPASVRGSFAGALGLPQFMPGSLLRHAVDYDGDAHIDLRASVADAIGSVAHFLVNHGWQRGLAVQMAVDPPANPTALSILLAPDIEPSFDAERLTALGVRLLPDQVGPGRPFGTGPLAFVRLENGYDTSPTDVVATKNFWVITRYNRSSYYALAVAEFAEVLDRERQRLSAAVPGATDPAPAPGR